MRLVRQRRQAARNDCLAVAGINPHPMRVQLFCPVGRRGDRESTCRVKAMPLGQLVGGQVVAVVLSIAQGERHDGAIEQADNAAQRADPKEIAAGTPAHRLRPRESGEAVAGSPLRSGVPPGLRPTSCRGPNSHRPAEPARGLRHACAGSRPVPVPARWRAVRVPWCCWGRRCAAIVAASAMRRGPYQVRSSVGRSEASASPHSRDRSSAARACIRAGISSLNSSRNSSGMLSPSAPVRYRSARNPCP